MTRCRSSSPARAQAARQAGDRVDYVELPLMGHMEYLDPASQAHATPCEWLRTELA